MDRLHNKTALITGSDSGIARTIAVVCHKHPYTLAQLAISHRSSNR